MSHQPPLFYSAKNGQQRINVYELPEDGSPWRDQNVNTGFGNFTVNNQVIQQTQPRYRYIRGTEEEEAEYEEASKTCHSLIVLHADSGRIFQYGEYKRSDIRLCQEIHRERITKIYDWTTNQYIPIDCERSIFLGEIVSGDGRGTIVTVEAYDGRDAPDVCILTS
ncbi:hypothetical protein PM082_006183 [Marasmius tenuissimus]|nr:hypothetical protein PM082_006183 [Marasmius tenuissimus]